MLKKYLLTGIVLRKLYDRRLLYSLFIIPSFFVLRHLIIRARKLNLKRPVAAYMLGLASGRMELLKLRLKMLLKGQGMS